MSRFHPAMGDSLSQEPAWRPWIRASPRVVVLHADTIDRFGEPVEYRNSTALQNHFDTRSSEKPQCSIYILESLCPSFAAVLTSHFQLHPAVFEDYKRLVPFNGRTTGDSPGGPFLPSIAHSRDYVTMNYHEPLLLSPAPINFRNLCDASGRHIAVSRLRGQYSDAVVARRKCTFKSRDTPDGGWDCKEAARQ